MPSILPWSGHSDARNAKRIPQKLDSYHIKEFISTVTLSHPFFRVFFNQTIFNKCNISYFLKYSLWFFFWFTFLVHIVHFFLEFLDFSFFFYEAFRNTVVFILFQWWVQIRAFDLLYSHCILCFSKNTKDNRMGTVFYFEGKSFVDELLSICFILGLWVPNILSLLCPSLIIVV